MFKNLSEIRERLDSIEEDLKKRHKYSWQLSWDLRELQHENQDLKTWNSKLRSKNSSLRRQRRALRKLLFEHGIPLPEKFSP